MKQSAKWERFKEYYIEARKMGFALDVSRMNFDSDYLSSMGGNIQIAFQAMDALEKGEIANPDEGRMVGHYWLRNAELAPDTSIKDEIISTLAQIKDFSASVHSGEISNSKQQPFKYLLLIGIGGSALGPKFVSAALASPADAMQPFFMDNTDPAGMELTLCSIPDLAKTLCIVISKSGGTPETRNGLIVATEAYAASGLDFAKHAVAITCDGSALDKRAREEGWLSRFPMWDWVGGRTSQLSAVGLLAAALQGFNIDKLLDGARVMDDLTRVHDARRNPAALMALMWHAAGEGKGLKDMVVLPYSDRLELFSRYLQQLIMESLGKELDLKGNTVNQGIAVYGNKGSTDQHAYVQQLREGLNNFFVVFIEVLQDFYGDRLSKQNTSVPSFTPHTIEVEPGITSGDYLSGFYQGTRQALHENGRDSMTITIRELSEQSVGMLIALFERAVGLYATLIDINAYHQPGVEAGKKAAAKILGYQKEIVAYLFKQNTFQDLETIAKNCGLAEETETVFKVLQHLAANGRVEVEVGSSSWEDRYKHH